MTEITIDKKEIAEVINNASDEPETSEQEYRFRVRQIADSVVKEDTNKERFEVIFDKVKEFQSEVKDSDSDKAENELYSSVMHYHNELYADEPHIFIDQGNVLSGLAFGYLRADVREEIYKREDGDGRDVKAVSLDTLFENILGDYSQLDKVYFECLPSIKNFSHLLITVYVERGPHEEFPERYSTDCVSVGSKKIPFAVKETSSEHKVPQDNKEVLVCGKDDKGNVEKQLVNKIMASTI